MKLRHIILALILPALVFGAKSAKPSFTNTVLATDPQCPGNVTLNPGDEFLYNCTGETCKNFSCQITGTEGTCIEVRLVGVSPTSQNCLNGTYLVVSDTNGTFQRFCDPTSTDFFSARTAKVGIVGNATSANVKITAVNCPTTSSVCKGIKTVKPGDHLVFNCTGTDCKDAFNCQINGSEGSCPVFSLQELTPTSRNVTICSSGAYIVVSDNNGTTWRQCDPVNTNFVSAQTLKIGTVGTVKSARFEINTVPCSPATSPAQSIQALAVVPQIEQVAPVILSECDGSKIVGVGEEFTYEFNSLSHNKFDCKFVGATKGLLIAFKLSQVDRPNSKSGCRQGSRVSVSDGKRNNHELCKPMIRYGVMSDPLFVKVAGENSTNPISFRLNVKSVAKDSPKIVKPPPKPPKTPKASVEIAKVLEEKISSDPKSSKKEVQIALADQCNGDVILSPTSNLQYTYNGEPMDCTFKAPSGCTPVIRPTFFNPASNDSACPSEPFLLYSRPDGTGDQKYCFGTSTKFMSIQPPPPGSDMWVRIVQSTPPTPDVSCSFTIRTICSAPATIKTDSKSSPVAPAETKEVVDKKTPSEPKSVKPVAQIAAEESTCFGTVTLTSESRLVYNYSGEGPLDCNFTTSEKGCTPVVRPFNVSFASSDSNCTTGPSLFFSNAVGSNQTFCGSEAGRFIVLQPSRPDMNVKLVPGPPQTPSAPLTFSMVVRTACPATAPSISKTNSAPQPAAPVVGIESVPKPPAKRPSKTPEKPSGAKPAQTPAETSTIAVDPASSCQGNITMGPGEVLVFEYNGTNGEKFDCTIKGDNVQPSLVCRSFQPLSPANSNCSAGYLSVTDGNGTQLRYCFIDTRFAVMDEMNLKVVPGPTGPPPAFNLTIKAVPLSSPTSSRVKKSIHSFQMPVASRSNVETRSECTGDHQLGRGEKLEFDYDSASGKKFDCTFWGKDSFEPAIDIHSFSSLAGISCSGDSFLSLWDGMSNNQKMCHETSGSVTIASQMMIAKAGKSVKFRATVRAVPGSSLDPRRAKTVYTKNKVAECLSGSTEADEARIVNGDDAEITSFPWQVGIEFVNSGKIFCGGSLINSRYVLTAAHCCKNSLMSEDPTIARILFNAEKIYANEDKSKTFRIGIKSVHIHPLYDKIPQDADYCMCELKRDVDLGALEGRESEVRTARLPCGNKQINLDHQNLTVSGYGLLGEGKAQAGQLQKVEVPVVSNKECQESYADSDITITSNMLCAGYKEGGKDACQGDSGGPLVIPKPAGAWTQMGVVSWGIGCAEPDMPGAYARVETACNWIYHIAFDGAWCEDPQ